MSRRIARRDWNRSCTTSAISLGIERESPTGLARNWESAIRVSLVSCDRPIALIVA